MRRRRFQQGLFVGDAARFGELHRGPPFEASGIFTASTIPAGGIPLNGRDVLHETFMNGAWPAPDRAGAELARSARGRFSTATAMYEGRAARCRHQLLAYAPVGFIKIL